MEIDQVRQLMKDAMQFGHDHLARDTYKLRSSYAESKSKAQVELGSPLINFFLINTSSFTHDNR